MSVIIGIGYVELVTLEPKERINDIIIKRQNLTGLWNNNNNTPFIFLEISANNIAVSNS